MNDDRRSKEKDLELGQVVMVKCYRRHEDKWVNDGIWLCKGKNVCTGNVRVLSSWWVWFFSL